VIAILVALLAITYDNVIFRGASLVYSDNQNPLDPRVNEASHGPGFLPASEWSDRNLLPATNFHDPGAAWWQWEPGGHFLRRSIAEREWPFWDPHVAAGAPAMANLVQTFFFPPYAAMVALGDTSLLKNAYFLGVLLFAATCSFLLLRRHGLAPSAAGAGAMAVLFCGGLNQNVGSLIGQAAACLPAALLLTHWFAESPTWRRTAAMGAGYGLMALASFPPLLVAVFGIAGLYAVVLVVGSADPWKRGLRFAIGASLGMALVAFVYRPAFVAAAHSSQVADNYHGGGLLAIPVSTLWQLFSPVLMGGHEVLLDPPLVPADRATMPYVGVLVLLLAGLASPRERRDARLLLGALVVAAVVIVAKLVGLEPVHSIGRLPVLEQVHFKYYFGMPLGILLGLLAGFGVDALHSGRTSRLRVAMVGAAFAVGVLGMLAVARAESVLAHSHGHVWLGRWFALLGLLAAGVVLALLLCAPGGPPSAGRRRLLVGSLLALIAVEGVANNRYPRQRRWDVWRHPPQYVVELLSHRDRGRIYTASAFPANAGSAFELDQLDSVLAFNPERVFRLYKRYAAPDARMFIREASLLPPEGVLDAANIGLLLVRNVHEVLIDEATERGHQELFDDGYVRLLARPTEPRHYFSSWYRVATSEQALEAVASRGAREVLLEQRPGFASAPNQAADPKVAVAARRNSMVLRLRAPRPGLVYAADSFAPGWRATVNGRPADVLPANFAFRAVQVPAGNVVVELVYFPPGLRGGLLVSAVAALILSVLAWRRERVPVTALSSPGALPGRALAPRLAGAAGVALLVGGAFQAATRNDPTPEPAAVVGPNFYSVEWGAVELPPRWVAGTVARMTVAVRNSGDSKWPDPRLANPGRQPAGSGAVRLGYEWQDADGAFLAFGEGRADLAKPLDAGASTTLSLLVRLPERPGRYRLQLGMVHELVVWFKDRGGRTLTLPVEVQPSGRPRGRPTATPGVVTGAGRSSRSPPGRSGTALAGPVAYSARMAVSGSRRTARSAGARLPASAIAPASAMAPAKTIGSPGLTPASSACRVRAAA
jgi:hypothetical protein